MTDPSLLALLDELDAAAAKATPGDWAVSMPQGRDAFTIYRQKCNYENWICQGPSVGALNTPDLPQINANAAYIALCSPTTITRMTAALRERLQKESTS